VIYNRLTARPSRRPQRSSEETQPRQVPVAHIGTVSGSRVYYAPETVALLDIIMLYLAMSIRAEADASYCYDDDIVLLLPTQYCYHAVIQTSYTYHTGRLTEHPQPPFFH